MAGGLNVTQRCKAVLRTVGDFVLPPRCAGCGAIIAEAGRFCPPCWTSLSFLGDSGCAVCGQAFDGIGAGETCAPCLADPPPIARGRAAVAYGPVSSGLVLRLKYGRKIALARTMAHYMRPLVDAAGPDALLVPVPLHRWRLWHRGFNQSLLVARELARLGGWEVAPQLLQRRKRTPPLRGMRPPQRLRTVKGAFAAARGFDLSGRTLVLIDDVETTGATAHACARALRAAGADRVELVTWARVVRPRRVDQMPGPKPRRSRQDEGETVGEG